MKYGIFILKSVSWLIILVLNSKASQADVIINEWSQGENSKKEWVELLVTTDTDMRGWTLEDSQGSAGPGGVYVKFKSAPDTFWDSVPAGTLIVIYNGNAGEKDAVLPPDDLSLSDGNFTIIVPHNSTVLFDMATNKWGGLNNTTPGDDNPILKNDLGTVVHDWDQGDKATFTSHPPKPGANQAVYYTSNDAGGIANAGNYQTNAYSLATPGQSNGGANTTWINTLRTPPLVNHACSDILLSDSSISENQDIGTLIGILSAVDPDTGNTHTFYRVVRSDGWVDNRSFYLDRNGIKGPPPYEGNTLKSAAVFDYEIRENYTIYIRCNDNQGASCFQSFTIHINDVNEPPTGLVLSYNLINEKEPAGTTVGTFSTWGDPDLNENHVYTLTSGDGDKDNSAFRIDNNALKTGAVFDYQIQRQYNIRVRTTDKGGLYYEKSFEISLNDVNEVPTDIHLTPTSIEENLAISSLVGTFSSIDENIEDQHTYTLVSGDGDMHNAFFYINGKFLQTRRIFNYEDSENTVYDIRVQTHDNQGGVYEKHFKIKLIDNNDAPKDIHLTSISVPENQPKGMEISEITTLDEDINEHHTYALVPGTGDDHNALFTIDREILKTNTSFDYEAQNIYTIRVGVTDSGGKSYEKSFIIHIEDRDDPPLLAYEITDIEIEKDQESISINLADLFTDVDNDDESILKQVRSSHPELISARIQENTLILCCAGCGTSSIVISGDSNGKTASETFAVNVSASAGDINCDGAVDLYDLLLILKILTAQDIDHFSIYLEADVNGDDKIGMEELMYVLRLSQI